MPVSNAGMATNHICLQDRIGEVVTTPYAKSLSIESERQRPQCSSLAGFYAQ